MTPSSDMYREQILDHYRNPRNYGELEEPTFTQRGDNPLCGDEIEVEVALDDDGKIAELRFHGKGCAISQASTSMLSERVTGEDPDAILEMDRDDVLDMLGIPISPVRVKCAVLGLVVLKHGIKVHRGEDPDGDVEDALR